MVLENLIPILLLIFEVVFYNLILNLKKNFNKLRSYLKRTPGGHPFEFPKKSAFDFDEAKRNLMYEKSWQYGTCLLYTSPSPRDRQKCRMPSSA